MTFINSHQFDDAGKKALRDADPQKNSRPKGYYQAQLIWADLKPRLDKGEKIGLLYSANATQTGSIHDGYGNNATGNISGGGQAPTFEQLNKILDANPQYKSQLHILPISTMQAGGGNVDKTRLDKDLAMVQAHKQSGFNIVGFQRSDAKGQPTNPPQYAIGGGVANAGPQAGGSDYGKDKSLNGHISQQDYVQGQLDNIVKDNKSGLDKGVTDKVNDALDKMKFQAPQASQKQQQNLIIDAKYAFVADLYKTLFKQQDDNYKAGYQAPAMQGKGVSFSFPDNKAPIDFLKQTADKNPDKKALLTVRNDEGDVVARIVKGKVQIFNGKGGFEDIKEDSVLPSKGMSNADYKKLYQPKITLTQMPSTEDIVKTPPSLGTTPSSGVPLETPNPQPGPSTESPKPH